jgi:hypothetical protein
MLKKADYIQFLIDAEDENVDKLGREKKMNSNASIYECLKHTFTVIQEIVANAVTLLFAGSDTTASTLAFTSLLLAMNMEKQQRVLDEIDAVCGKDTNIV